MDFINQINIAITKVEATLKDHSSKLEQLEKEFSDVKLNPYGITTIDFSQRQELLEDTTKMEGVIMGLNLAKETYESTVSA
tara:strand:+ start:4428 stop:4670 length:243 start_codon:yes stop_codon:yes gene_type:complete